MEHGNEEKDEPQLFLDAVKDVTPLKHGIAELTSRQSATLDVVHQRGPSRPIRTRRLIVVSLSVI
jgi:hypothetical protein